MDEDKDVFMGVTIGSASFVGTCKQCGQPMTGLFDYDDSDGIVKMKCVGCSFRTTLDLNPNDNNFDLLVLEEG